MENNNITIKFTTDERDIILEHTFAGPDLTKRIQIAELKGKHLITQFDVYELEDLIGYIAAEANHAEDRKIGKKLDKIFERLSNILNKS